MKNTMIGEWSTMKLFSSSQGTASIVLASYSISSIGFKQHCWEPRVYRNGSLRKQNHELCLIVKMNTSCST